MGLQGVSFGSLVVIALVTLLVLGPSRLQAFAKAIQIALQQINKAFHSSEKTNSADKSVPKE